MNELEQAIEILDKVQPSLQDVLFERYFRNGRYTFAPTEKQKKYLASLDTLKVLCIDHDAPYVYQKNGKPAGMLISILEDFEKKADVTLEYTFCENSEEAEELIKKQHYDFMVGMSFTSRYCAENGFVRSKSIMESNLAYVHDSENNSRKRVVVQKGLEDYIYDSYSSLVTSLISGGTQVVCIAIARDSDLQFIRLVNDYIYSLSGRWKYA